MSWRGSRDSSRGPNVSRGRIAGRPDPPHSVQSMTNVRNAPIGDSRCLDVVRHELFAILDTAETVEVALRDVRSRPLLEGRYAAVLHRDGLTRAAPDPCSRTTSVEFAKALVSVPQSEVLRASRSSKR